MKSLRCAAAALLGLSLGLMACPEKKADPIPPKVVEVKPPVALAPPPGAEPRADKECAAPIDPGPVADVKFGERTAKQTGARLVFADKDTDGALTFGVLGPVNEDSGLNMLALKKYV